VAVRWARSEEWRELRELRLHALADAPYAFETTLAQADAWTDDQWRDRFDDREDRLTLVEESEGGALVGMAFGLHGDGADVAYLAGMFVAAPDRGRGIGSRLVAGVEAWAREVGASRVELEVNPAADAAAHFYKRCGYRPTGITRPMTSRPDITVIELSKKLSPD
jgi:GNAT superfamily N-acetyltransferase